MKKILALLAAALLLLSGCTEEAAETTVATTEAPTTAPTETVAPTENIRKDQQIRVLLPEETLWCETGSDIATRLEALSYPVEIQYAEADPRIQAEQLEAAVSAGVNAVIIAPIDSTTLTAAADKAAQAGIPLIAYDRLLMDTEAVRCYVAYDYRALGNAIGTQIVLGAALDTLAEGESRTIEFFMGSPEDSSSFLLYLGLMDVLEPYLHSGVLLCPSGRTAFEDTCVVDWDSTLVAQSLVSYGKEYYRGGTPQIICTASDSFASVCITTLADVKPEEFPLITGLGGTEEAAALIEAGTLAVTASVAPLGLNETLVLAVDALLTGGTPDYNDQGTIHNNAISVPSCLCDYTLFTK